MINVPEIFYRILLGFSEYPGANQVKNHVSDILGRVNAPAIENRHDQRSELLERVLPQSLQELRSSHVPDAGALRFLLLFRREIERVTQKNICISLVSRIAPDDGIKRFSKSNFLHGMKKGAF